MAWLSGWSYRVKIIIDHDDIDVSLTDFPVLVYLSSSRIDWSHVQDDLDDIRFTSSDGETLLKYEIEKYTVNDEAWLWVKIPSISSSTDTEFYMYYGNADALSGEDPENVWNSNFKGVWHMDEDPSGTPPQVDDSTGGTAHDGTSHGSMTSGDQISAKVDGGLDFDGAYNENDGDWIEIPHHSDLMPTSAITLEMWVNISDETTARTPVSKVTVGSNGYMMYLSENEEAVFFAYGLSTSNSGATSSLTVGNWYYLVGVYDGSYLRIYVNGTQANSNSATGSISENIQSLDFARYASNGGSHGMYWGGSLDEVRISNSARSAGWIKATYESEIDDLLSFGSEETRKVSSGSVTILMKGMGLS